MVRTDKDSEGQRKNNFHRTRACGDIQFYGIDVKYDLLEDEKERLYFKKLPTSFKLKPEDVDNLLEAAQIIMNESPEFQRLLI